MGSGPTEYQADRRALLELAAEIEGREVESVTEDYEEAYGRLQDRRFSSDETSILKAWISEKVRGTLPAEAHVADRHVDDDTYWAHALVERPGMRGSIDRHYQRKLTSVRRRSFAPGLAQFEKGESQKAWAILGSEAVGVFGWGVLSLLSNDMKDRRSSVEANWAKIDRPLSGNKHASSV